MTNSEKRKEMRDRLAKSIDGVPEGVTAVDYMITLLAQTTALQVAILDDIADSLDGVKQFLVNLDTEIEP